MFGKSDVEFSNHWKNGSEIFQALENPAEKVPLAAGRSFGQATLGKSRSYFFQPLENSLKSCPFAVLALKSSPSCSNPRAFALTPH
ncbi:MAG TPA: hypothetical protein PLE77_13865 [Kiritimatiellia bacterium]|nr:hypothetical protein [Kiritimatiellia bacterium]